MKYLITYIEHGKQKAFYSDTFDIENHFNADLKMIVYDLTNNNYFDGVEWLEIKQDHL